MARTTTARAENLEGIASQLLREARLRAHLSQRRLATMAGVPQSTVARIEGGHMQPSLPLLYRILGATGLKPRTVLEPADEGSIGAPQATVTATAYRPMAMADVARHLAGRTTTSCGGG